MRDHPRLRGEHPATLPFPRLQLGSPPPARGAFTSNLQNRPFFGITPACAGSIKPKERGKWQKEDHPRLRGEHSPAIIANTSPRGSPPPARGAYYDFTRVTGVVRITPACAGSIPLDRFQRSNSKDHPRLRGEHIASYTFCHDGRRITPACAGSIDLPKRFTEIFWDHPRLRGEHRDLTQPRICKRGSPPPARGA